MPLTTAGSSPCLATYLRHRLRAIDAVKTTATAAAGQGIDIHDGAPTSRNAHHEQFHWR